MQGAFFAHKHALRTPPAALLPRTALKETTQICNEDDFFPQHARNDLNDAFIAEDSKLAASDSQSVASEGPSISNISNISEIRRNSRDASPILGLRFEEEFSGPEDWSVESFSFSKCSFKRPAPSIDEEYSSEEMEHRCTKKKMNEKMKVLTISSKASEKSASPKNYLLRSRAKATSPSESSSNEELREMINDIEKQ
jgi:hypothetical protein